MAGLTFTASVLAARSLGPAGRGSLAVAMLLTVLTAAPMAGPQAAAAHEISRRRSSVHRVAMAALATSIPFSLAIVAVALAYGAIAGRALPESLEWGLAAQVAVCGSTALMGVFLGREDTTSYNVLNALPPLLTALTFVALVATGNDRLQLFLGAWTASQVAAFLWAVSRLRSLRGAAAPPVWSGMRFFLRFALVAALVGLTNVLNWRVDFLVVSAMLSTTKLGIYSVALQSAESLWLISLAISVALYGRLGHLSRERAVALVARSIRQMILGGAIMGAVLFILAPTLLPAVFGPQYREGVDPVRILLVGIVPSTTISVLATYFTNQAGRPRVSLAVGGVGAALNAGFSVLFVPRYGITGAAIATSGSYLVQAVAALMLFQRSTHVAWRDLVVVTSGDLDWYRWIAMRR